VLRIYILETTQVEVDIFESIFQTVSRAPTREIVFIYTCSSLHFMGRSKCESYLLMVIYKIRANHDDGCVVSGNYFTRWRNI